MMALQLPEPDYYTLAEVLKRWSMTETILLRLAREGKIRIGFTPPHPFPLSVFGSWVDDEGVEHDEEIPPDVLARETLYTLDDPSKNLIVVSRKILLHPWAVPNFEDPACHFKRDFFPQAMELWPHETIPWLDKLPNDWFLMVPLSVQAEMSIKLNVGRDLLTALAAETKCMVPVNRIVVPTSEIHRIENQHEAAEKAVAEDVLGTKDKERLQGMIAAMAQIIASKAPAYKNGDKPNATQIADAIVGIGIVDRKAGTIAKEITAALKQHGK